MQQCLLEPGHCRFTGIHKVGTLLLSVRKCGSWEGCKKSKFAQIYRPLAIIDQGKIWALSACGKSEGLLNFQVLLVRKVPMENCPLFSEKKKKGGGVGRPCLKWPSFRRHFLRLALIQHKFSIFHFWFRTEEKVFQGLWGFTFQSPEQRELYKVLC